MHQTLPTLTLYSLLSQWTLFQILLFQHSAKFLNRIFETKFPSKISVKMFSNFWNWSNLKLVKFLKTGQIWNWSNLKLVKFETGQIWNWSNFWNWSNVKTGQIFETGRFKLNFECSRVFDPIEIGHNSKWSGQPFNQSLVKCATFTENGSSTNWRRFTSYRGTISSGKGGLFEL